MKDLLIEIKNNLQGNNRADEAKNPVNNLEYKEANNKKKKEFQKMRVV